MTNTRPVPNTVQPIVDTKTGRLIAPWIQFFQQFVQKAAKIIDPLMSELDMFTTVKNLYSNDIRFFLNMDCLWIWHRENEKYTDREEIKAFANTTT